LQVNQGALYPALHRLEQQGWIQVKWEESENNRRAKFLLVDSGGCEIPAPRASALEAALLGD
jgi:DNA-binding PadR family transcriptional regulator